MEFNRFYTFPGGIFPRHLKSATRKKPIRPLPEPPERVICSLKPKGEPECTPAAAVGDHVVRGALIGTPPADGTPVYASVSGVVEAVEPRAVRGGEELCMVIRTEEGGAEQRLSFTRNLQSMGRKELLEAIRLLGIGEMDGHSPALHRRLRQAAGKAAVLIINGCESEPLVTADGRLMAEEPDAVLCGARYLMELTGTERCVIAIEANKLEAIEAIRERLPLRGGPIRVQPLKAQYPQGMEQPLVYTVTGVELSHGQTPLDAGAVVVGASAAAAVFHGLEEGLPLVDRVVTVAGSMVERPQNLRVPLGTELNELLKVCEGCKEAPRAFLMGGPMTGMEITRLDLPVQADTNALLALGPGETWGTRPNAVCVRCGRCVQACPMRLMPLYFHLYQGRKERLNYYHIENCIECGTCAYVCPAHIPLTSQIRQGKRCALQKEEER